MLTVVQFQFFYCPSSSSHWKLLSSSNVKSASIDGPLVCDQFHVLGHSYNRILVVLAPSNSGVVLVGPLIVVNFL